MRCLVLGGGIAGVSCAKEILHLSRDPELEVLLVSASNFVKSVENYRKIGQFGEKFDVKEVDQSEMFPDSRFRFLKGTVIDWDASSKEVVLEDGSKVSYDKLCIATGSRPKFQHGMNLDPRFVFLRDTQSALDLQKRLETSKRVLIVGNGGIATELVYELQDVKLTWMVRDTWICASFFPEDVEKFIEQRLLNGRFQGHKLDGVQKHLQHAMSSTREAVNSQFLGPAMGPDWCSTIDFKGTKQEKSQRSVKILRNCHVEKCRSGEELVIEYTDDNDGTKNELRTDLVIWAGGVTPNSEIWSKSLKMTENGGICVNDVCETSVPDVFASGDVCSLSLPNPSTIWNQRQLWTQARQLGQVSGRSMVAGAEEARMQNLYFELFSHCTTFFGLKVVFLGDYKPQRQIHGKWKVVIRDTEPDKLVRCVVVDNRIVGALLIGETDMEETIENLILNRTDLSGIADTFLEPGVDLDDYFD